MIKIYGLHTCPYCDYVKIQIADRQDEFRYIDIGEHVKYMSEFIKLRDHHPAFDHAKEVDDLGLPAFVEEDGSVSLDPAKFGLKEYAGNCSINGHEGKRSC